MTPQLECGARRRTQADVRSTKLKNIIRRTRHTRTHRGRERESVVELGGRGRGASRVGWQGSRLSLAAFQSLSPPGSRSCSQDCCSHQQTAVRLHLGSPRRKDTVIPRDLNVVSSRCRVPPSQKNHSCGSHHSLHPQRYESQSSKAWRKTWKREDTTLFHSFGSNCVAVTSAFAPRGLVWWQARDSPVCGRRKPSVRLCLCNSRALSLVRPCLQRAWLSKPSGYP